LSYFSWFWYAAHVNIAIGKPPCDEQDLAPYYPPEPGQAANISLGMKAKKYLLWAKYVPRLIKHRPGVQDPAIIEVRPFWTSRILSFLKHTFIFS
jgi:hypothetical protein